MARSLAAASTKPADAEQRQIISWYSDLLERTTPPAGLAWEPVKIGPTWQWTASGWLLPARTLGWDVLAWCGMWLRDGKGAPWQFTAEQSRFILWYYALDESGDFLYHSAVLQRLKGWGKDPLLACLSAASCFADVSFDHWDGDRPVGREEPNAYVQLADTSWNLSTQWYPYAVGGLHEAGADVGLPLLALVGAAVTTRRSRPFLAVIAVMAAIPVIASFHPAFWQSTPVLSGSAGSGARAGLDGGQVPAQSRDQAPQAPDPLPRRLRRSSAD